MLDLDLDLDIVYWIEPISWRHINRDTACGKALKKKYYFEILSKKCIHVQFQGFLDRNEEFKSLASSYRVVYNYVGNCAETERSASYFDL